MAEILLAGPADRLSAAQFAALCDLVRAETGVVLGAAKQVMVETRLRRRVRARGFSTFTAYADWLMGPGRDEELPFLIDEMTTHKTDFFREPGHFDILEATVLPERVEAGAGRQRPLRVWSVACSTGPELWTLAMVTERFGDGVGGLRAEYFGTDISTVVLDAAARAIYPEAETAPVPEVYRSRWLTRARDPARREVRVAADLRRRARFAQLNLMDARYDVPGPFDVAFLRNVLIYFDRDVQRAVVGRVVANLVPGGYLFTGHAENIGGYCTALEPMRQNVYRKRGPR